MYEIKEYRAVSKEEALVHLELKFKDSDRSESFFFTATDWEEWEKYNDLDSLFDKYWVKVSFCHVIHNPNYIMGIYNK